MRAGYDLHHLTVYYRARQIDGASPLWSQWTSYAVLDNDANILTGVFYYVGEVALGLK